MSYFLSPVVKKVLANAIDRKVLIKAQSTSKL